MSLRVFPLWVLAVLAVPWRPVEAQVPDLHGRWEVQGPGGEAAGPVFFLSLSGSEITGRREAPGEAASPVTGEVAGGWVSFRFSAEESGRGIPVAIRARLVEGALTGEMEVTLPSGRTVTRPWRAVRGPPEDASPMARGPTTVDELLRTTLARTGWPGISVAWCRRSGECGASAAGMADRDAGIPMSPASRMPAGSVGKTFVAAVALQLAAEGRVELDAPISVVLGGRTWFQQVPNARDLTLRLLLQHSGGLADHVDDPDFAAMAPGLLAEPDLPASPEAMIATVTDDGPLFPAGSAYGYTDTGYLLAGLVLEEVTGEAWWRLLEGRVLRPAGLDHSVPQDRRAFPDLANGHPDPEGMPGFPPRMVSEGRMVIHPGTEWTGGGVVSTPTDLARWGWLLYGDRFLPVGALEEMLGSRAPGSDYGLGVRLSRSSQGEFWGHDGWFPGYRTKLAYFPGSGTAIALQVNTDAGVDLHPLLLELAALLDGTGGPAPSGRPAFGSSPPQG